MIAVVDKRIQVEATVDVEPAALFAVLADPRRHTEIDGSDSLRGSTATAPISAAGQVFTMRMHLTVLGDYATDNRVLEFEPDRLITWSPGRAGQPPAGVRWSWRLDPTGEGRTRIVHTYDWSGVTDPAVLARIDFPRISAQAMRGTVDRLAAAARRTD